MNLHEVAGSLDEKSIEILQLLVDQERHLNPGLRGTLTTPTVKRECGWTNQTVLRRFRKLEGTGLVRLSDVDSTWPEYDRYPRPPKAIERAFDVDASDIREVINLWDGRETRSPAQLTDDLNDLCHRIGATDDRLTSRIDDIERKQYAHLRQHALADRERSHHQKRALTVAVGAVTVYLLVVVAVFLFVPELLASVVIGGTTGSLGIVIGIGLIIYAKSVSIQIMI